MTRFRPKVLGNVCIFHSADALFRVVSHPNIATHLVLHENLIPCGQRLHQGWDYWLLTPLRVSHYNLDEIQTRSSRPPSPAGIGGYQV